MGSRIGEEVDCWGLSLQAERDASRAGYWWQLVGPGDERLAHPRPE